MNPSYGTRPVPSSDSISAEDSPATATKVSSASFRDPAGRVLLLNDRVLRLVTSQGAQELKRFLDTRFAREAIARAQLVNTTFLESDAAELSSLPPGIGSLSNTTAGSVFVEHEAVAPRSFPYEWSPLMLHAAGALMLNLAAGALSEGFSLKDATPYNVLFKGAQPIFVDVLSFELRDAHDPTWLAFNQFVRTILLPLLLNKYFGLRLDQLLLAHREGIEPAEVARVCGPLRKLSPLFLTLVFLPAWLGNKSKSDDSIYRPRRVNNAERAKFVLEHHFKRLRRQLDKLRPAERDSNWSGYMTADRHFSDDYLRAKESFVSEALENLKPRNVLDVGCNTGYFSRLAAERGASVVAIDQDEAVVDSVWKRAAADRLDVLPLVVNLARPTPAVGWRNEECPSFLDRARGKFDLVLMLAVLHHLLVSEQIPLPAILELAAELTSEFLIVEFVAPADPMFHSLVRGRDELYRELTKEAFERFANEAVAVMRSERLNDTRWIYLLRKR